MGAVRNSDRFAQSSRGRLAERRPGWCSWMSLIWGRLSVRDSPAASASTERTRTATPRRCVPQCRAAFFANGLRGKEGSRPSATFVLAHKTATDGFLKFGRTAPMFVAAGDLGPSGSSPETPHRLSGSPTLQREVLLTAGGQIDRAYKGSRSGPATGRSCGSRGK
jgi:hypothetical protein